MNNKVYTGDTSIKEHLDRLVSLYGASTTRTTGTHEARYLVADVTPVQSIQIRKLKLESGLE